MYCDLYWQPYNIWNKVNLFIKYHIQGIVRVYQWVTGNPRKSTQGGITGLGGQNEQK